MSGKFDRNLIVIGAGSAGLMSAYMAAALKARVTLVEADRMGGDCLYSGCVPSKSLIRSARACADMRSADRYGINPVEPGFDFSGIMERVQGIIRSIEPHDSPERYSVLGVECIQGKASLASPHTVNVEGRELSARRIIIATGARPFTPPIKGLDKVGALTSETVWDLRRLPPRLAILGGGPIGCEMAQCFARFGSRVTLVEMAPRVLSGDDPKAAEIVHRALERDGVRILTGHKAVEIETADDCSRLVCESDQPATTVVEFDHILAAAGRRANTEGLDLDRVGVRLNPDGTVETDKRLRTSVPSIYACGDVAGPYQFTHTAAHQAWYASVNSLFDRFRALRVDYSAIPRVTYTEPELAQVGYTRAEAEQRGLDFEQTVYELGELDRARTESATQGFVMVLTTRGKDRILGATIVGAHAGEMITEFTLAIRHGLGLNRILSTIHPYPTWMEANRFAAGAWKRAHAPAWALSLLEKYHRWQR